jgi:hypothetical protein
MGMVLVVEGIPWFAAPDKIRQVVMKVAELPEASLRRYGFFMMALGLLLVWLGKL